ncbi:unnamed protein product [Leuciscus chuanchicus]
MAEDWMCAAVRASCCLDHKMVPGCGMKARAVKPYPHHQTQLASAAGAIREENREAGEISSERRHGGLSDGFVMSENQGWGSVGNRMPCLNQQHVPTTREACVNQTDVAAKLRDSELWPSSSETAATFQGSNSANFHQLLLPETTKRFQTTAHFKNSCLREEKD